MSKLNSCDKLCKIEQKSDVRTNWNRRCFETSLYTKIEKPEHI